MDFALKVINWDSDVTVRLQLWDIAGKIKEQYLRYVSKLLIKLSVGRKIEPDYVLHILFNLSWCQCKN